MHTAKTGRRDMGQWKHGPIHQIPFDQSDSMILEQCKMDYVQLEGDQSNACAKPAMADE